MALRSGATLVGAIGLKTFGVSVEPRDRPRFRIHAVGPKGERILLDETAVDDFRPDSWQDYRIPVPGDLGSPVSFHFEIVPPAGYFSVQPKATPVWAQPRVLFRAKERRRNVILVVFDTLRADHTQPYGYPKETTPFLNRLASRGAAVAEMVATYPATLTSHWSIFTGLFPARHGVYPGIKAKVPTDDLAIQFQTAGYRTAAFTEGGYVHSLFGFGEGFDVYHNGPDVALGTFSGKAADTFERARRWIGQNKEAQFFVFLHTYKVHAPYTPSERYRLKFDPGYEGRWKEAYPVDSAFAINNGETELTRRELDHLVALYDAEIRELDEDFQHLWKALDGMGALRDSIVVITADHGEDLMEHGWLHHGTTLYDPALLVPFIVVAPGVVPAGAWLACQRSLVDLMPTVLELAGIPVPSGLDGASIARDLSTGSCAAGRAAYSELVKPTYRHHAGLPLASVREGGWKLIRHVETDEVETYRLPEDPGERNDIGGTAPDLLKEELTRYLAKRPKPKGAQAREPLPEEMQKQLKALGYLR